MRRRLISISTTALMVLVFCNGCASSRMRSVASPQFKGRQVGQTGSTPICVVLQRRLDTTIVVVQLAEELG